MSGGDYITEASLEHDRISVENRKLRAELDELRAVNPGIDLPAVVTGYKAQKAEIEKLRAAMRPFAWKTEHIPPNEKQPLYAWDDDNRVELSVTAADVYRLRQALGGSDA